MSARHRRDRRPTRRRRGWGGSRETSAAAAQAAEDTAHDGAAKLRGSASGHGFDGGLHRGLAVGRAAARLGLFILVVPVAPITRRPLGGGFVGLTLLLRVGLLLRLAAKDFKGGFAI